MYGIEVYSKVGSHLELTEQEWEEIKAAVGGWMLENEGGNGNTVYVEAMDADKTVRALNAIGFTTDEDYLVAEDDDDDPQPVPVIGGFIEANKARTAVVLAKARELASKQGQWVSRDQFTEKQLFDLEHTRLQTVTEGRWHNVHKWGTAREGYVYTSGPIGDGKLKQCDTTFEVTYLHEACNVMVSIAPATQWHY